MKQTQQVTIKWPNDGYGLQDYVVTATVHGNDQPGDFDPDSPPSVNITHVMFRGENLVGVITETQERLMKEVILEKAANVDSVHEQNFPR